MKSHVALSTVVTTLIILVVSVLLASVVTYFAINVTSNRAQEEALSLTKQHVWFDDSSRTSEAAIMIVNTGGRDVVISKLTVRGQDVGLGAIFYYEGQFVLTADIAYTPVLSTGSATPVGNGIGGYEDVVATTKPLTLPSGQSMLVYISNPDSISVNDVGTTVPLTVFTAKAAYYIEANVQGASSAGGNAGVAGITISNQHAWYDNTLHVSQVALVLTNNGANQADFDSLLVANGPGADDYFAVGSFTVSSPLTYVPSIADLSVVASQTLQSGQPFAPAGTTLIVYIKNPSGITANDIGNSVGVQISLLGLGIVATNVNVVAVP